MTKQTPEIFESDFDEKKFLRLKKAEQDDDAKRRDVDEAMKGAIIREGLSDIADLDSNYDLLATGSVAVGALITAEATGETPSQEKIIDVADESTGEEIVSIRVL